MCLNSGRRLQDRFRPGDTCNDILKTFTHEEGREGGGRLSLRDLLFLRLTIERQESQIVLRPCNVYESCICHLFM